MFAVFAGLALLLFFATSAACGATLLLNAPSAPLQTTPNTVMNSEGVAVRFVRPLLLTGVVVQFAAIGAWCVTRHLSPFASETGTLSVVAWAMAIAYAVLDWRCKMPAVGAVALLLACLAQTGGIVLIPTPAAESPILSSQLISLHVLSIVSSFGLFAVAFGCAALYLVQSRILKQRTSQTLFRRLPPLANLDLVAYRSVAIAFPLLTLGLALGLEQASAGVLHLPLRSWLADPRILLSFVAWFLYLAYLTARLLAGWRGVRLQYVLLLGMILMLTLYLIPTTTHRFN